MSGNKYFIDTNAIIALLNGNKKIEETLNNAQWIDVSVISVLEFLAYPTISPSDIKLFNRFLERIDVIPIMNNDIEWLMQLAKFKSENNLKLPDAIIGAYSVKHECILITKDKKLAGVKSLRVLDF